MSTALLICNEIFPLTKFDQNCKKNPKGLVKEISRGPMVMSFNPNLGKCIPSGSLMVILEQGPKSEFVASS